MNDPETFYKIWKEKGFVYCPDRGWFKPDKAQAGRSDTIVNSGSLADVEPIPEPTLERARGIEKTSDCHYTLRIEVYRKRPADIDNEFASAKLICDALRYSGILPEDNPYVLQEIIVKPLKAHCTEEEHTEITLRRIS